MLFLASLGCFIPSSAYADMFHTPFYKQLNDLLCQFSSEPSVVSEPLCEVGVFDAMLEWWALLVCTWMHAAIDAAALTIFVISQGVEPVWNWE